MQIFRNMPEGGRYVPISSVLKNFLEIPNVCEEAKNFLHNMENNESPIIEHFGQGSLWKSIKKKFGDNEVFPLIFFVDDFSVDNELGSHKLKNKMTSVYCTTPWFQQGIMEQLKSKFLVMLFKTSLREEYSMDVIYGSLVDELKQLEEVGIEILGKHRVFFASGLIIGDNLGIHEVYGSVTGFTANYPCRHCRIHKSDMQNVFESQEDLRRNRENYEEDLKKNNQSETGIKEPCVFNQLKSFHVTENLSIDLMHDWLLGTFRHDIPLPINSLIEHTSLDLNIINSRISNFDYGADSNDKPPIFTQKQLDNKYMVIHASEMYTLIKYLPAMLGDYIPRGEKHCDWFLQGRKLVDLLFTKAIHRGNLPEISATMTCYFETRKTLYPDRKMRPKDHFGLHSEEVINSVGPLANLTCMRDEARHQNLLSYAKSSKNKVDIALSTAKKVQIAQAFHFMKKDLLEPSIIFGPFKKLYVREIETSQQVSKFLNKRLDESIMSSNGLKIEVFAMPRVFSFLVDTMIIFCLRSWK